MPGLTQVTRDKARRPYQADSESGAGESAATVPVTRFTGKLLDKGWADSGRDKVRADFSDPKQGPG